MLGCVTAGGWLGGLILVNAHADAGEILCLALSQNDANVVEGDELEGLHVLLYLGGVDRVRCRLKISMFEFVQGSLSQFSHVVFGFQGHVQQYFLVLLSQIYKRVVRKQFLSWSLGWFFVPAGAYFLLDLRVFHQKFSSQQSLPAYLFV